MRKLLFFFLLVVFWTTFLLPSPAQAGLVFLDIPSVAGEDPTPGHPGTMAVQSLTVVPKNFSVVKRVDVASPHIFNAVVNSTVLGTVNMFFYNSTPTSQPDATLSFQNVIASSYLL